MQITAFIRYANLIMYLNKTFLFGNLTRDPEMKSLPSGQKVTSFSLATNRVYKDAGGAKKEEVEFHNIVIFGKTAEVAAQYLRKGSSVLIEGRIQTRSWDDKTSGEKKYRTEIITDSMQLGPKPSGDRAPQHDGSADDAFISSTNLDDLA